MELEPERLTETFTRVSVQPPFWSLGRLANQRSVGRDGDGVPGRTVENAGGKTGGRQNGRHTHG